MINYSQYKRTFVSPGIFFTTSGAYTGAVDILSGVPFIANTNTRLSPAATFETDVLLSPYFKNRAIKDIVDLPYKESDILFQPNDFLNGKILNDRLKKLKLNNTFVYSRLFMADNDIPLSPDVRYAGSLSSNETQLTFFDNFARTIPFSVNTSFSALGNLQSFVHSPNLKSGNPEDFTIFAVNSSQFIALTGTTNNIDIIETSDKIEAQENSLTYGSLKDICIANDFIFITDSGNGVVYKYEISGYINEDNVLTYKRNLIEILGNNTNNTSKPQQITTNGKNIAFYDAGTREVKVYDTNFNFIKKVSGINLRKEELKDVQYGAYFNLFYALTRSIDSVKLYVFDGDRYAVRETYSLDITFSDDEDIVGMEFAKADSDYYYIFTNKQTYKLFVSRPDVIIGRYIEQRTYNSVYYVERITFAGTTYIPSNFWNSVEILFKNSEWFWNNRPVEITPPSETILTTLFTDTFNHFRIASSTDDKDRVIGMSDGRVYIFQEPNSFKKVLKQNNLTNYSLEDLQVQNDEYIQSITLNKELFKVVRDIITLKNNIVGRFFGEYDYKGKVRLQDYNYNLNYEDFKVLEASNYFLHNNEKNNIAALNRVMENILTLQKQLVAITAIDFGTKLVPVPGIKDTDIDNVLIID